MIRQSKYAPGEEPANIQRTKDFVEKLKANGGKRCSYNWRPHVVEAIEALKLARPLDSETEIIADAIVAAAKAAEKKTKK